MQCGRCTSIICNALDIHDIVENTICLVLKVYTLCACRSKKGFAESVEKQAKRAAFYIYWNVKPDSARSFIIAEDFEELLPLEQSQEAFSMLNQDGNGQLTPKELCRGVTQIYK